MSFTPQGTERDTPLPSRDVPRLKDHPPNFRAQVFSFSYCRFRVPVPVPLSFPRLDPFSPLPSYLKGMG